VFEGTEDIGGAEDNRPTSSRASRIPQLSRGVYPPGNETLNLHIHHTVGLIKLTGLAFIGSRVAWRHVELMRWGQIVRSFDAAEGSRSATKEFSVTRPGTCADKFPVHVSSGNRAFAEFLAGCTDDFVILIEEALATNTSSTP
jgi:hypothetical protein